MQHNKTLDKTTLAVMTLNIWEGRILTPLLEFIKAHRDTDIFCFQEVYSQATLKGVENAENPKCPNIQERLLEFLPKHRAYFRPVVNGTYGISTFVHEDIKVPAEGEYPIYTNLNYSGQGPSHSRILQWLEFSTGRRDLTLINVHGLWNGQGKSDSSDRIMQSNRIRSFIDKLSTPVVLCGDFNIMPDTKSIEILAEGMQDFIKRDNIASTRSSFYKKSERHADYIFASQDIEVTKFTVFKGEVSDHLPLSVEFIK